MRTEKDIENELINWLVSDLEYEFIKINSKEDMEQNIIDKLSIINRDVLGGREMLPSELREINKELLNRSARLSNHAYNFNKVIQGSGIIITDATSDTSDRKKMTIKLISNTPSNNYFQVAHQIRDNDRKEDSCRYDVTLLLNGFPVVDIELKGVQYEFELAISQIDRYIESAFNGYFKYLQLYVVSNEMNTRYFVNNNSVINKEYAFKWADEKNKKLDSLCEFSHSFFEKHNLYDILTRYIVRYGDKDGQDAKKPMIVMRPYQIHAVRAVLDKIKKPIISNGYVFHTTGSGKTMTSWKCAQLATEMNNINKVIFLVDRRDLNSQTLSEFKSVDSNIDVDESSNTKKLLENFKTNKLIVTTIQKFHKALGNAEDGLNKKNIEYNNVFGAYRDRRVLFIIDECHRTQFGEMHKRLAKFFQQSQFIGFTGTPIFKENAGVGGKITSELFGTELHRYSIEDAIRDKSVLGFAIDYHNTLKGNEKLEALSDQEKMQKFGINADEIKYNKERIANIVDRIYAIHNKKTLDKKYNALFAVDSIKGLLKYYEEFKRHNELLEESERLRVSAIFTVSECIDEDNGVTYDTYLKNIINDYCNEFSGSKNMDFDSFREELARNLKLSPSHDKKLDIVIVVGIFLTGFDSKYTNTMYVDKNLEYHGLLQAFSRTNRVESSTKPFGNIVCFRPLKDSVDAAISLFSSGNSSLMTVSRDYTICFDHLCKIIDDVNTKVFKGLHVAGDDYSDAEKRDFVLSFRELNKALIEAKQFVEFDWNQINEKLSKDTYNKLLGEYKNIYHDLRRNEEKESILDYIDFCMELVESDRIDFEYIRNLVDKLDTSSKEGLNRGIASINALIDKTNNDSVRNKKELIKNFLEELAVTYEAGTVKTSSDIEREFRQYVTKEKHREIKELSSESNINIDVLKEQMDSYELTEKVNKGSIRELVRKNNKGMRMRDKTRLTQKIVNGLKDIVEKFKGLH